MFVKKSGDEETLYSLIHSYILHDGEGEWQRKDTVLFNRGFNMNCYYLLLFHYFHVLIVT